VCVCVFVVRVCVLCVCVYVWGVYILHACRAGSIVNFTKATLPLR